jgi:hypothetical protein
VRRYNGQVKHDTNGNGCPVPQSGTDRYKGKLKSKRAGGTPFPAATGGSSGQTGPTQRGSVIELARGLLL